ncbi:LOW QUALITY PROTEIN: centromere protein F [Sceloporus undulatus]|uniref:LOW QUALITY PROTEIN: centromere protein F n=1 Tax=Sceloporus undulatus TaxID=8520 RepID=UPI001C4BE865|nr:LOW QUALITY PROTEIN: centromere protein F [Sceloporus undulatus]
MSWAVEEWKEGLSTRVLHKIQELESHLEKLKKERQQKQFQLESLEAALQKQKQKVEQEKNEGATLKRENQNLMELCDNLENARQKLCHELQVKESQVNFQEGQLISSKKNIEKLEQELKRYKSELEKSQKISIAGDASFDSTPQKNFIAPLTPTYYDSKFEELQAKYSKEVEERKRLEAELKSLKSQKTNAMCPESMISRRAIARQQASSSVFSWQQEKTPSHFSSSSQETPIRNGSVTSHLPQEPGATPSHRYLKSAKKEFTSSSVLSSSKDSPLLNKLKAQNQELRSSIQELEHKLQIQTQDMKFSLTKLQETQLQLENLKLELAEKDKVLNKTKNEMSRITAQLDQATDQCAAKEEKVKRLSEELSYQRQNFQIAQHALQEKIKEKEKECQKEHSLHLGQVRSSLQGELLQAKDNYNLLKAELEKTCSAKQELQKKANDLTEKLSQANQTMQTIKLEGNELKNMCEEVKKQNSLISCQAAQQLQEICQLKDELCVTKQLLQQSQHVSEDMKNKNSSLENELKLLEGKLNKQDNLVILENMKLAISDLENQRDSLQQLLKHKENIVEELSMKLGELETLQKACAEGEGLKIEIAILSQWKKENEQLLIELGLEKEGLKHKICSLENALMIEQVKSKESLRALENENVSINLEMKNLNQIVEDKTRELQVLRKANADLQEKNATSEEKHRKERENNSLKLAVLVKQVADLQEELESSRNEVLENKKCIASLEASLASCVQLDIHLQKQSEGLSQARDEMQRKLMEVEQKHTDFVQEKEQEISRLQTTLFDKQDLLTKVLASLKESDEKLKMLIKESDGQQADIQDLKIEKLLHEDSAQQLQILPPSVSQKELDLSMPLSSNKKENEQVNVENSIVKSTVNNLELKNLDFVQRNLSLSNNLREREENLLELSDSHSENNLLMSEAKKELERKCLSLEAKNENLECVFREEAYHLEVEKAKFEVQEKQRTSKCEELDLKLMSLDKKKDPLLLQLEKNQPVPETGEILRQEGAAQNKMQYSGSMLLQGKGQLVEAKKMRNEHATNDLTLDNTSLEQLRLAMEEKEDELHKYQVKLEMLQMDIEDKEVFLENYFVQVKQLETVLRTMEMKLEESEIEKENLKQELQGLKHLENQTSEMSAVDGNDQSSMYFSADTKGSIYEETDANCSSLPHNLMPGQNDYVQLVSSLHMTLNKLNELEKMCEHLQIEKLELKDSQLECIVSTDIMAQELMDKSNKVKEEGLPFSSVLIDKNKITAQPDVEQIHVISLGCCDGIDYEDFKLSNKEIKAHFESVKEKIFSLKKLYEEQSLNMSSKISELQCYIEMLKEKNIALSTSLYQVDTGSFAVQMTPCPVDIVYQSDEFFCIEFPYCGETSYYTNITLTESSFDGDLYKPPSKIDGLHNNKQANLEGIADRDCHSLPEMYSNDKWVSLVKQEHLITKRPSLKNKIEPLLSEPLEMSFKKLEESFWSHKNLEDKEIQKIQELLHSVREEVDGLQKQTVSDNKQWHQKLHNVILQVTSTLTTEKKHIEMLSQVQEEPQPKLEDHNFSFQPLLCVESKHHSQIPAEQANHPLCQLEEYDFSNENLVLEMVNNKVTARTCEANGTEIKRLVSESEISVKSTEKLLSGVDSETRKTANKSVAPTNCPDVLSFPPNYSRSTVPMTFLENHMIVDGPYSEIKQDYSKNKFSCNLEESSKNVDSLQLEIQCLKSNLDLKDKELAERINVCAELDKTVAVLKQEKIDLSEALKSVTFDNQQLSYNLMTLGIELNKAKTDLDMYKRRLSDATDALHDLEITKADWTEKFLETENELRRIKSEKTNVENHALFMEADIEELQSKNKQLEKDKENELKTIFGLQDQLRIITTERNQFIQDLSALSKDKEELDQKCQKMQETIKELESSRVDSAEFIRILETEAKTQAKLLQVAKADNDQLSSQKEGLILQLQNLNKVARDLVLEKEEAQNQVECLREEKEASLQEYETLHSKLSISKMENAKISKSLEGSLIEKGELADRLNSAQEEVDQLRRGIEKLKIKIEADEKNKHCLAEKWKETERKADSLVDKIESLERELQMSEENLEDAILQAEVAKAETEIANAEIEKMCVTLQGLECEMNALKSEKEYLENKLEEKQVKLSILESSHIALVKQVEEEEKGKVKMRGEYERELLPMEFQLNHVHEEVKLSLREQEILGANEQDLFNKITSLRQENTQLVHHLEEGKHKNSEIEELTEALIQAFQDIMQKMDKNSSFLEQMPKSGSLQDISQDSQESFKLSEEELETVTSEKNASLGKGGKFKKEYVAFRHKFQQWLESCIELKQEKKLMMNQIHKLETQLKMAHLCCHKDTYTKEMEWLGGSFEERAMETDKTLERKKLKVSVEETATEADLNLDKFCALLINHHKLEEENEMLRTQVSLLNAQLKQSNITSSPCQSSQSPAKSSDRYPIEHTLSEEVTEITSTSCKSQENRSISEGVTSPLLETITNKSNAFQHHSPLVLQVNTEHESDGSLVMEREGTDSPCLSHSSNQRKSPCLVYQSLRISQFSSNPDENSDLSENLKAPAEGSKLQKISNAQLQDVQVLGSSLDFTSRSPLSAFNQSIQADAERFERSAECLHSIPTKWSLNSEENELNEACHVQ